MKKDYFTWHWYLLTVQEQVKKVKNQFQMQSEWFNFISKYYNFCKLNSTFGLHISSVLCYFVEKVGSWRHCFKSWSFKSITFGNPRTAWKVFKYGVFSGPYFPAFGLNTERYWIRRDTKYLSVFSPNAGKHGPEITPYLYTFHTVEDAAKVM